MVSGYVEAVEDATLTAPLPALDLEPRELTGVRVPAWCARTGSGYYNDYRYGYVEDPRLTRIADLAAAGPVGLDRISSIATAEQLREWVNAGDLVAAPRDLPTAV
jgi:hypothetical protein